MMASANAININMDNSTTLSLQQFRLWSTNALKAYLRIRSRKTHGDFEELVARYMWLKAFTLGFTWIL